VEAVEESQALVAAPAAEDPEAPELFGNMNLLWHDCGGSNKAVDFTGLTPSKLHMGRKTKIHSQGQLSRAVTTANITVKMAAGIAGLALMNFDVDGCSEKYKEHTLVDQIGLTLKPLGCPLAPGDFSGEIDIWVSPILPKFISHTTTTVVAHDGDEEIFCLEVVTSTSDESPWELPEIMV